MKYVGIVLLCFVVLGGLSVVGVAFNIITLPWLNLTSKVTANQDIIAKTYDANNVIYNYHWFQERSGEIKALADSIQQSDEAVKSFEDSAGDRKSWTFEDKNEDARLKSVAQGQKQQYNSIVQEYNARAGEADRALFKDNLPMFFKMF